MPIVDITGFGNNETAKMKVIRGAIQQSFRDRWGFRDTDNTTVNFSVDPSVEPSLLVHVMARIYTKQFVGMTKKERDAVCDDVYLLMEKHGGHIFNEAFPPKYDSMRGRENPNYHSRVDPTIVFTGGS